MVYGMWAPARALWCVGGPKGIQTFQSCCGFSAQAQTWYVLPFPQMCAYLDLWVDKMTICAA